LYKLPPVIGLEFGEFIYCRVHRILACFLLRVIHPWDTFWGFTRSPLNLPLGRIVYTFIPDRFPIRSACISPACRRQASLRPDRVVYSQARRTVRFIFKFQYFYLGFLKLCFLFNFSPKESFGRNECGFVYHLCFS
jgi:hypothetical protein